LVAVLHGHYTNLKSFSAAPSPLRRERKPLFGASPARSGRFSLARFAWAAGAKNTGLGGTNFSSVGGGQVVTSMGGGGAKGVEKKKKKARGGPLTSRQAGRVQGLRGRRRGKINKASGSGAAPLSAPHQKSRSFLVALLGGGLNGGRFFFKSQITQGSRSHCRPAALQPGGGRGTQGNPCVGGDRGGGRKKGGGETDRVGGGEEG